MNRMIEEILEAMWKADEVNDISLASVRGRCPVPIAAEDLELLVKRRLVVAEGETFKLTATGHTEATSVVRRHRLAESLFATVLNLDADKREEIACEVEHTLLPEVEEGICILLGHPIICPDGKPIPPGPCCASKRTSASPVVVQLTSLQPGEQGRVTYVRPKHHERLHRLNSFGLTTGTVVSVHQRSPAWCIRYDGTELALDRDVAEDIYVTKMG